MRVLVTGGTGFIGRALVARLLARGDAVTVLSRRPAAAAALLGAGASVWRDLSAWTPETAFDAVINLAGEPIVDRPWTSARRRVLRDSRIGVTERLLQAIRQSRHKPAVLLSGSAIGIYGNDGPDPATESTPAAADFGAVLCADWEHAALEAERLGVRVCLLRTGLVLHCDGGLLKKMRLPFALGLGSRLGDGRQAMSWIHRGDHLDALLFLLDHGACRGAYNLTAPMPVSNREFTETLARSLKRPALLAAPAWALRLALGQRAPMLLGGRQVLPERLLAAGFRFRFPALADALAQPAAD